MKMTVNNSRFSAHGGIREVSHASDSDVRKVSNQTYLSRNFAGLIIALLMFAASILVIQNHAVIIGYFNKPIRVVLMENPLQSMNEGSVRSVLAAHLQAGFFGIDVRAIKSELEADPWVDQVIITRIWPDTLSVSIIEEVAIAKWGDTDLINQYGETFRPDTIIANMGLPFLKGPDGSARRVMEQYQVFSQMLSASGMRIQEIELSNRGSWTLNLDSGQLLTLGRNDVHERMQRFILLHDRRLRAEMASIDAFDLRYTNGISIRKKSVLPAGVASK